MTGIVAHPEGITEPPIDELLGKVDSKYALVVFSAKRARDINTYNQQVEAGMLEAVGPLVDCSAHDKPLSVAMQEINEEMLDLDLGTQRVAGL